ncbi:hypothetical protein LINPERHAP2_LOCUS37694 [Linum perenne]
MENHFENIDINGEEDERFEIVGVQPVMLRGDYELGAVRIFLTTRSYNFNTMRTRLAAIWQPSIDIQICDLGNWLVLFPFFHVIDMAWCWISNRRRSMGICYCSTS